MQNNILVKFQHLFLSKLEEEKKISSVNIVLNGEIIEIFQLRKAGGETQKDTGILAINSGIQLHAGYSNESSQEKEVRDKGSRDKRGKTALVCRWDDNLSRKSQRLNRKTVKIEKGFN